MAVADATRISRPALARRLRDGLESGSVILVAGAGYGKTMALEEALAVAGRRSIWLSCGAASGEAGRLLVQTVRELRRAVPGVADVVGDALATATERVDVRSATAALLVELERLLVEPLIIVLDEAEELEGADAALAVIEQLLGVHGAPLSLAIATRSELPLRLTGLRARGRLLEIGPAELSFTASECEELLRMRTGRAVREEEVEAAVAASQGWPMGVALTGLAGSIAAPGAVPREELFQYLAEEVFDQLDPALRLNLVDSSVPDALTPALVAELGLPPGFLEDAAGSGLFLRQGPSGDRSYHPLFREFLRERLPRLRDEEEMAALHARAAAGLAAAGRGAEAIEHWLTCERFEEALAALAAAGPELVRTSPDAVASWLEKLPPGLSREPDYLLLEAQLLWGTGHHESALEPLRQAVDGFAAIGDVDRVWSTRVFLADTLVFTGTFERVLAVAEGWEDAEGAVAAEAATAVAWFEVVALSAVGRAEEADALRERLRQDSDAAAGYAFLDPLARAGGELGAGRLRGALEPLREAIAHLEMEDPLGRLPYVFAVVLVVLRTLGERERALEWIDRGEREAERAGLGFVLRDFWLQRAALLAQGGELPRAEAELARADRREGMGWRGVHEAEAEAQVALLRGDGAAAATAARRALRSVAKAPMSWRALAAVEMSDVLVEAGAPEAAAEAIAVTMADLDRIMPGEGGRLHRAWLLSARAAVEQRTGSLELARRTMRACWEEAGEAVEEMVRARWRALRPVLWDALAAGTLSADEVLPVVQAAVPGGEALVAMVDHPAPDVRRAALLAAVSASHPAVLARLDALAGDADPRIAAAATAARSRLRGEPPPLRFELLGGFRLSRAGWELDESAWQRPMAARIVRFLLLHGPGAVPEDALFEAFWADRPADAARQHLAVAVSRARKVLDLPGAVQSAIEVRERTYRLLLRERDGVDAAEFEAAAAAALAERGEGRRAALERAAELWTGEPLPEDRYAEWTTAWRERLAATHAQLFGALIETYARAGEHDQVIRAARRLLDADPLNEAAHRSLIAAYARTGRTSRALRQYLECRHALVVELGVEPSAETSGLQARILAGETV
jgi:ATP/maltotriose-dependent transcriptional regulator MalT/DNA-binding SARP family transcriptional activator